MNDSILLKGLCDFLNEYLEDIPLPREIVFDRPEASGENLWLAPLSGTVKKRRYVDGGYMGELPFAIRYQRTNPVKGTAVLDVPLWAVAEFFAEVRPRIPGFSVESADMTGAPHAFFRGEDGTVSNQALYKVTYTFS